MNYDGAILITGASSGLGRALALACAAPGVALHLSGRDVDRLAQTAQAAGAMGAQVQTRSLDVRDRAAMADWVGGAGRLGLVIANAGVSAGTLGHAVENAAQIRDIFAVNLDGALNTALPALEIMAGQPPGADGLRGRVAVVASIAALLAVPGAPSYCASKAALDGWAVATAPAARRQGIGLTSLCPGYIHTPMTAANPFPMPGIMAADRAAAIMLRGIEAGRMRVAFPWWMAAAARLADALPVAITRRMLSRVPGKPPG